MLARRCGNKDVGTQVRPLGFYAEDSESEKYLQKTYAAKSVALTGFLAARCVTRTGQLQPSLPLVPKS